MLLVGVRYASRYEPGHGLAIQTFLYRRMRIRYTDWLRATMGDTRWGKRSARIPPFGRTWPLHEEEGALWDGGYDEVDERLSTPTGVA